MARFLSTANQEHAERIQNATCIEDVKDLMERFLHEYQINMFAAALISKDEVSNGAQAQWLTNATRQHYDDYTSEGWINCDYGVRMTLEGGAVSPFFIGQQYVADIRKTTEMRPDEVEFYNGNATIGLRSGLAIPMPTSLFDYRSGVSIWSDGDKTDFDLLIQSHGCELVTFLFACQQRIASWMISEAEDVKPLSPRERDCLLRIAKGKRPDAIGDDLGLATVTVNQHIRHARIKLNARTNAEAIAKLALRAEL